MNNQDRKIIFLLPGVDRDSRTNEYVPVGGYKVVYQYANMFAADGYDVEIAYSHARCHYNNPLKYIHSFIGYYYRRLRNQLNAGGWFSFYPSIRRNVVYRFSKPWFQPSKHALIIATAYDTAVEINNIKSIPLEQKAYFIQGYEIWAGAEDDVKKSYNFGFKNITIAPWLKDIINNTGADTELVYNGFDFNVFKLNNHIEDRNRFEILMLNHTLEHKRCQDAWAAICKAKEIHPDIHVNMFGTCAPPVDMPEWCDYHRNPSKEELVSLYNKSAIYVAASDFEGFGLTVGEAMICGCAVACTDNGGFACMAKHEQTALLSPIYDVEALSQNIIRLIKDDELRYNIAKQANKGIKNFSWDKSYAKLKEILLK